MPYSCTWIVPGRVLVTRVDSEVSLEEIAALTRDAVAMVAEEGRPPVYLINDLRQLRRAPRNLSQLRRVVGDEQSQAIGCYIILVGNPIFGFIGAALVKLARRPVHVVTSEAEALACLSTLEPDLVVTLHH